MPLGVQFIHVGIKRNHCILSSYFHLVSSFDFVLSDSFLSIFFCIIININNIAMELFCLVVNIYVQNNKRDVQLKIWR